MVVKSLFLGRRGNTISWLVLPILCLEWDVIAMYSWGSTALFLLYHALCDCYTWIGEYANLRGCTYLLQVWM
jgi:hypothetical protein